MMGFIHQQGWIFVDSGNEMEHETFLATWLAEIDFSLNGLVSKYVFLDVDNKLCDQYFKPTYKMIQVC